MQNHVIASGIEGSICKTWEAWEGDTEWLYFYNVELLPEIKDKCVEAGLSPDAKVDLDISMTGLECRIVSFNDKYEEVFGLPVKLVVTPKFD